ncbi:sirohydrochlorin chelatase [Tumebacillus flagellatus]|uniref:Sirohydrochlorin cobaltochelatase n=1 Tax=Tumebacillus flagellatus TaxID=1157490 RepID=A0A074LPN0_9BACL|nr:sirohydrochlorin chelatase [Tumebacillus flagellatus]KEO81808.1 sirohydrochlorin cobaltochelatase [Tumebacillus flagellatus]
MSHAILLVGHGSRVQEGNDQLLAFAKRVEARLGERYPVIETCFLELTTPTIAQGISACVERGATRVTLVPIILFGAGHSKIHIPHAIDNAREQYPGVEFSYGKPIGVHPKALEILMSRLEEAGLEIEAREGEARRDEAILIVGRGSSDPDANSDLFKVSRLLWERTPVKYVETCYIGVTDPNLEDGLRRCRALGAKRVYVLPYFLFTGVLIQRIEDYMEKFRVAFPEMEMRLAEYFGFHDALIELVEERAEEAAAGDVKMNCDHCQYRLGAMADHHHHDHDHHHDHEHHHDHDHHHDHEHHDHDHEHHDHEHVRLTKEAVK